MRRYWLAAMSTAATLALAGHAMADMAAAEKWIAEEFQPSTLSEDEQKAEMEWFIKAAEPFCRDGDQRSLGDDPDPRI